MNNHQDESICCIVTQNKHKSQKGAGGSGDVCAWNLILVFCCFIHLIFQQQQQQSLLFIFVDNFWKVTVAWLAPAVLTTAHIYAKTLMRKLTVFKT